MKRVSIWSDDANSFSTIGPVTSMSAVSGAEVKVSTRRTGSGRPSGPFATTPLIHSQSG